jgi:hypothetical protein
MKKVLDNLFRFCYNIIAKTKKQAKERRSPEGKTKPPFRKEKEDEN